MSIKDDILKAEIEYPKLFSRYIEKEYGILFFNQNNKKSHDSNHAVLFPGKIYDFDNVINEITDFYSSKKIVPRIYPPFQTGFFQKYEKRFERLGYSVRLYGDCKFMLLDDKNIITCNQNLDIKRIQSWDYRIANDIYLLNGEEFMIEVEKNSLKNDNYFLFGGFLDELLVTIISFHISQYNCTRFDYIVTAKDYRKRGYAKQILRYAVNFCIRNNLPNCYQWPANEVSEKISTSVGFKVLFREKIGSAIYMGKIKLTD